MKKIFSSHSNQNSFNHLPIIPKIEIISKDSPYFPKNLLKLSDCPDILFTIGNKEILNSFSVSIVGTRNSSTQGNEIAFDMSQNLSSNNIVIVSGMASGIDTQAHLGAINTIAIVACGFSHLFAKSNLEIINSIINSGGAIISEYFPNTPPQKYTFLNRNRLIAAISNATLVIEAPLKSGALNTAQIAKSLNKPVFSVPWNINLSKGKGCNSLLENGALLLTNYTQVLVYFKITSSNLINPLPSSNIKSAINSNMNSNINSNINTNMNPSIKPNKNIPKTFLPLYKYIKQNEPVSINQIILAFEADNISKINSNLVMMELQQYIKLQDNNYYIF